MCWSSSLLPKSLFGTPCPHGGGPVVASQDGLVPAVHCAAGLEDAPGLQAMEVPLLIRLPSVSSQTPRKELVFPSWDCVFGAAWWGLSQWGLCEPSHASWGCSEKGEAPHACASRVFTSAVAQPEPSGDSFCPSLPPGRFLLKRFIFGTGAAQHRYSSGHALTLNNQQQQFITPCRSKHSSTTAFAWERGSF